jgi:hypothetical protein
MGSTRDGLYQPSSPAAPEVNRRGLRQFSVEASSSEAGSLPYVGPSYDEICRIRQVPLHNKHNTVDHNLKTEVQLYEPHLPKLQPVVFAAEQLIIIYVFFSYRP